MLIWLVLAKMIRPSIIETELLLFIFSFLSFFPFIYDSWNFMADLWGSVIDKQERRAHLAVNPLAFLILINEGQSAHNRFFCLLDS